MEIKGHSYSFSGNTLISLNGLKVGIWEKNAKNDSIEIMLRRRYKLLYIYSFSNRYPPV